MVKGNKEIESVLLSTTSLTKPPKPKFKGISISDIHLGDKRFDHITIRNILSKLLLEKLKDIDVLFVDGDIFDGIINVNDLMFLDIHGFIVDLLREAARHNVIIRFLRGTFSHDRNQISWIMKLYRELGFKNDVKYYDSIDVEYIQRLGITVGYMPDNLPYGNSDQAISILKEKMLKLNKKQTLDYVLFHGSFEHIIRGGVENAPKVLFKASQFSFVKKCVFAGHIHTPSIYKNVYYNGSPNRMAHNEEEDKGYLYFEDFGDCVKVKFVKNDMSPVFKTLDYSADSDTKSILSDYKKKIDYYTKNYVIVYVRIIHPDITIRQALKTYTEEHFPHVYYQHTSPKDKSKSTSCVSEIKIDVSLHKYQKETLPADVSDFIKSRYNVIVDKKKIKLYLDEYE